MLPVDVVMNGEYLGSYLLAEVVRVDDNRVEIDELTENDNAGTEVTGGYLLSYVNPVKDEPEGNIFTTNGGLSLVFNTPAFDSDDPDDELGTPEQKAYISYYLQETEDAIYSGRAADYMDLRSAADYWLAQTFCQNTDAFATSSTYLYKPRGDKLYWGPLWDFDYALDDSGGFTEGFNLRPTPWLDYLRENYPDFRLLITERWGKLKQIITDIVKQDGVMDRYIAEIKNSWEDNLPLSYNNDAEFTDTMNTLRTWLTDRQEWINDNIDQVGVIHSKVTFIADDEVIEEISVFTGNRPLLTFPQAPKKDGMYFLGWQLDGEVIDEFDLPVIWEDTVLTASYISIEDVINADNIFFDSYEVWAPFFENGYSNRHNTGYVVTPDDAQEQTFAWSSSDETVAEVNEEGVVSFNKTGDVTITATMLSGASRSYTLHIYDGDTTEENDAEKLVIETPVIEMKVGEYAQIPVMLSPQPCDAFLTFDCDNEDVVEELDCFVFKALAPGTVTVTISDFGDLSATCTIIVTGEAARYGDANADGKIDILDVTDIQRHVAKYRDVPDEEAADVNGDEIVTIGDATCVQMYLAEYSSGTGKTGQLKDNNT